VFNNNTENTGLSFHRGRSVTVKMRQFCLRGAHDASQTSLSAEEGILSSQFRPFVF